MAEIGKKLGRKLSVASLGYDKPTIQALVIAAQNDEHFLVRFVGSVTGLKPYKIREGERAGETAYGLIGQFEATAANGEVRDGSVLYLPGYVNDAIVAAFTSFEDVQAVKIAYDVYAEYDVDSATSYIFTVRDLLNAGSESVSEVKEAIKALPLPNAVASLTDGTKKK